MPTDDIPFEAEQYVAIDDQAALINDALASSDAAFVRAALRTAMHARDLTLDVILPEDPRLSVVLAALDRLGIDLLAVVRKS